MKLSLRYKIIAVNLTVLVLTFAAVSIIVIERLNTININMLVDNLKYQSELSVIYIRQNLLSAAGAENMEKSFASRSAEFAAKLSNEYKTRVIIFSNSKEVLADSENSMERTAVFKELDEVIKGNRAYVIRTYRSGRYLHFAFPVLHRQVIGAVMFIHPLMEIDKITRNTQLFLLVSFLIGLAVIVLTGIPLSFRITRPILQLKESAIKLAAGNFNARIPVKSSDETGELAEAFNAMSKEIENRINIINLERAKLNSVLESMGEGVIAVDGKDEIIAINTMAKSIIDAHVKTEIKKLSSRVRSQKSRIIMEMETGRRNLLVCATPLCHVPDGDGVVFILNDITELRLLQEKQRQFVTNVSHELKTPLTTIIGYAELLKEKGRDSDIFETSVNYLLDASDRLLRLVNDLIDLSVLSKSEFEIERRSTNLSVLVRDIVGQMSLKARKFNIKVDTRLSETPDVNVDPVRIKQAVVNILDNAVKYSPGGKIYVELSERDKDLLLVVSDTGCGIPSDVLENIFEPFFRADKARSRAMGGNGLGLSITKEIIDKHNGKIHIESREGEGTTVYIVLPKTS